MVRHIDFEDSLEVNVGSHVWKEFSYETDELGDVRQIVSILEVQGWGCVMRTESYNRDGTQVVTTPLEGVELAVDIMGVRYLRKLP